MSGNQSEKSENIEECKGKEVKKAQHYTAPHRVLRSNVGTKVMGKLPTVGRRKYKQHEFGVSPHYITIKDLVARKPA